MFDIISLRNNCNNLVFLIPEIDVRLKSFSFKSLGKSFPHMLFDLIIDINIFNLLFLFSTETRSFVVHLYALKYYIIKYVNIKSNMITLLLQDIIQINQIIMFCLISLIDLISL